MSKRIHKQHEDVEPGISSSGGPAPSAVPVPGLPASGPGTWLSPATVLCAHVDGLDVLAADGRQLRARLALALPYAPAVGDELLLLGDASSAYVVGVLRGAGMTRLALEGDVELSASGRLGLRGGAGVSIDAPEVQLSASRFSLIAGRASQIVDTLRTTVRELMSVRAGEQHTLVEGTSHLQAKNARVLSESKVTINGKEIFLG